MLLWLGMGGGGYGDLDDEDLFADLDSPVVETVADFGMVRGDGFGGEEVAQGEGRLFDVVAVETEVGVAEALEEDVEGAVGEVLCGLVEIWGLSVGVVLVERAG